MTAVGEAALLRRLANFPKALRRNRRRLERRCIVPNTGRIDDRTTVGKRIMTEFTVVWRPSRDLSDIRRSSAFVADQAVDDARFADTGLPDNDCAV